MSRCTPAQNALLRKLHDAPNGLPTDIVHSKTIDGLERRGLVRRTRILRTVTVEMVQLVDGPSLDAS